MRFGRRRHSLDRLLDTDEADRTPLGRLLAAARGPGTEEEVAGLADASRAFYLAGPGTRRSPVPARRVGARASAKRWLAVRAIAGIAGVSLLGGVAYAATNTGLLDGGTKPRPAAPNTSRATESGSPSRPSRMQIRQSGTGRATTATASPASGRPRSAAGTVRVHPHLHPSTKGGNRSAHPSHPARPDPSTTRGRRHSSASPSHPTHPTQEPHATGPPG